MEYLILAKDFKNSEEAKTLDLFNVKLNPPALNPKGIEQDWNWLSLVWNRIDIEEKWVIMVSFGENLNTGLYYSFVANQSFNNSMEFSFASRD